MKRRQKASAISRFEVRVLVPKVIGRLAGGLMFFPASLPRMVQNFVFGSLGSASESVLSQVLQRQASSSLVRSVLRALISGWVWFDSRI